MAGRHSPRAEDTEYLYVAEGDGPRGKHVRTRGRRRRQSPLGRVILTAVAATAVGGVGAYAAFAAVGLDSSTDQVVAANELDTQLAEDRDAGDRASRSGRACTSTGPGQQMVEDYLTTQAARFGKVTPDGSQDGYDCAAIKKFQHWAQLPYASGYADAATGDLAARLAASDPQACQAQSHQTTVCVDLSHQVLWMMRGGSITFEPVLVRTGRDGAPTPVGVFSITEKKTDAVASGTGEHLRHWQRFGQNLGIHTTTMPFHQADDPGSHGDVTLLARDAAALYQRTQVGTVVRVFGQKPNV